jgi:hypothetical protein
MQKVAGGSGSAIPQNKIIGAFMIKEETFTSARMSMKAVFPSDVTLLFKYIINAYLISLSSSPLCKLSRPLLVPPQ